MDADKIKEATHHIWEGVKNASALNALADRPKDLECTLSFTKRSPEIGGREIYYTFNLAKPDMLLAYNPLKANLPKLIAKSNIIYNRYRNGNGQRNRNPYVAIQFGTKTEFKQSGQNYDRVFRIYLDVVNSDPNVVLDGFMNQNFVANWSTEE